MKTYFALLALGLVLAPGAQADLGVPPNSLSVFFHPDHLIDCISTDEQMVEVYLVLLNPTFDQLKGLECHMGIIADREPVLGVTFPGNCMNVGDLNSLILAFSPALPTSESTLVATWVVEVTGEMGFTLGGVDPPSIEGEYPVVVDGQDNTFQVMTFYDPGDPCAWIKSSWGQCVLDTEDTTWGALKSLYR